MKAQPTPRTYSVQHQRDLRPGERLHWRLYTHGNGHWCIGTGHSGSFETREAADQAGRLWVAAGLPPCHQHRAARLAAAIDALARLARPVRIRGAA